MADTPGNIHEYTIDLYYANGVLAGEEEMARFDWTHRVNDMKFTYPLLKKALKYGEAKLAYNVSYLWGVHDFFESFLQYAEEHPEAKITWELFKKFMEKKFKVDVGDMLEKLSNIVSEFTLSEQREAYQKSVKHGHGVITVSHSQGNFFTNQVFESIVKLNGWMKPYLHMLGVASPSKKVFNDGSHVTFDNDMITAIPGNFEYTHTNPNRKGYKKQDGSFSDKLSVAYHGFEYYMGEEVSEHDGKHGTDTVSTQIARIAIEKYIMNDLDKHLAADSQWVKAKNYGCLCKDKRIIMKHIKDDELTAKLASTKVFEFDEEGKLYHVLNQDKTGLLYARSAFRDGATIENVEEAEVCYELVNYADARLGTIEGTQEKPQTKDGVVEIFLSWTKPELDYDLIVEWDAGEVDVKDTGCSMEHFHIKSEMKIYPGTYRVSILPKDGSDEAFKDENLYPFEIDLITKTPGASDTMHFVIKNQSDITLGHVSDIKVFRVESNDNNNSQEPNLNIEDTSPFIIMPEVAPECPPVQITPSSVPPRPIYFPVEGDSVWSFHREAIGSSSSSSNGISSGGGYVYPVQHDPGCAGDVDCLPIPTDNNTNNTDSSANPYTPRDPIAGGQPVRDLEKEDNCTGNESCGCIPCEYEIIPYLKQIYFGPLRDTNFSIYSLDGYVTKESLFDGKTSNGNTLYDAGEIDVPQVFLNTLEDNKLYIIEAQGGEDIDSNDDFVVDVNPTKNLGKVYAIASGKDIKYTGFKVNILTTVTFELLQQSINDGDTGEVLEKKINQIASRLLKYKVYPNQTDSNITNVDLLAWLPTIDQDLLLRSYTPLKEMVVKTYAGENIYSEAYAYVFYQAPDSSGELPFNEPIIEEGEPPIIKTLIADIAEDASGATVVGKIEVLRGSSDIRFGELSGKGSEVFEVNSEGEVKLRADSTLDYETKWLYKLKVEAFNKNGSSGLVAVYISVQNVLDAPEYVKFEGGRVDENITGGTKVGQIFFEEGASAITEILMNGTSTDLFTIDNNGTIRLAPGETLDYEEKYSYGFVVIAKNSYGSSMPVILYINVRDVADSPQITNYTDGYVHEDASVGTFVGKVVFNGGGSAIEDIYLSGEGSQNFSIDMNGSIRVSDTAALDYETYTLYQPTVTVTNSYGSATRRIFISVVDAKDVPSFISFSGGNVRENSPVGTVVAQVVFDPGSMPIDSIVMSGEGSEVFKILDNGTIVAIEDTLNYEEKNHYVVKVTASNALGSSAEVTVHLFVDDVSEQAVVLEDFVANNIEENLPVGTVIGQVVILDTGSSPLEFFEISGEGADKFSVDTEGIIRVERVLDFEQQEIYNLHVKAKNGAGFGHEVNLIVRLSNIAEHPPVLYAFKGFIEENASVGTVIGNVLFATKGDTPVSMRLEGEGKENFDIDNSGTISVSSAAHLDEATQKVYTLSLVATNEAGESKPADALITLTYDKTIPYKPANLELLDIGHNSITLGWVDNAQNERGFNLYRDGVKHATLDANTTSYRITGLAEESTYFFTLKSFNDRGESQGLSIVGITDIDRSEYLKAVLGQKCGISETTFDANFNVDTGYYNGSISCAYKSLSSDELLNFRALKEVRYDFHLYNNQLTDLDGLKNLKRVGRHFYLHNNKLTNVDGLSKLASVGSYFRLEGNQLTNVNGLSSLTSVGSYFYLNNNQLTNLNGLSSLKSVKNNFSIEGNQLTNLDGLSNLRSLGGSLALRNNPTLTDISGVSNVQGNNFKLLYINPGQYTTKANEDSNFCSTTWDLRDKKGNIADDMTQVCDSQESYTPSEFDKFRDTLGEKCNVSSSVFYSNFNDETGYYNGSISCAYQSLTSEELLHFKFLKEVKYDLYLYNNQLTDLGGLSNLKKVGRYFYLYNNQLTNVDGLNKLESVGSNFHLMNNKLENINGLSNLKSVGGYLYLQNNQLTNLNGLNSLTSIGGNFNIEENQLTKLDGLTTLTSLGGYLALRANTNLTDISGVSNIQGKSAKLLYINPGQYTTKASEGSNFCSTTWDLRDPSGNIADDMTQVCESQEPYTPSELDKFRDTLGKKCNMSSSTFYSNFNVDTGYYNGTISCSYKNLTDEDLLNFKFLKEVKYYFYLNHNKLTNLDGLSNLRRVGRYFYLHNNQLTNVDGLSKLESVGSYFRLDGNKLTNVNGLSSLTSVGSHFYLNNNQITNLNGLSSLTSVKNNFNIEENQLINLDGLSNLSSLGGSLALRGNTNLTDISGINNVQGSNGKLLYINSNQYTTKANGDSSFCSTTWDLRDPSGNIEDDMTQVCDMNSTELSNEDKLRNILGEKCNISSSLFYSNFNSDTGYYNGSIRCVSQGLTSAELLHFKILKEVKYDFHLYNNQLTDLDGLINLKRVGRYFYLYNNQLTNVDGLSKLESVGSHFRLDGNQLTNVNGLSALTSVGQYFYLQSNKIINLNGLSSLTHIGNNFNLEGNQLINLDGLSKLTTLGGNLALRGNTDLTNISGLNNAQGKSAKLLYINPSQYTTKAKEGSNFCINTWDLRDPSGNIADDMTQVCDSQDPYTPSDLDKFRDVLGEKCNISSSAFYTNFNADTGYYKGTISCAYQSLTSEELLNFKILKEVKYDLYLYNNQLTNVDGLINLQRVGRHFYLYNNKLEDINGLSKLKSVGSHFYLQTNQLTDLNGLSSLIRIGNNFNVEGNDLSNLDGLNNLTSLGGYLALRGNADLIDISGVSNAQGSDGQILYINPDQYEVKANENLKFCSTTWNIRDVNGDVDDNMTQVCGEGVALTETQKLRAVMEKKCSVSFSQFANNFDEDMGIYNGSLDCAHNQMKDDDLLQFSLLNEITGSFSIDNNSLTKLDGLSNLSAIGGYFYLQKNQITDFSALSALTNIKGTLDASYNQIYDLDAFYDLATVSGDLKIYNNVNLTDIAGISNIIGIDGKKIYIDSEDYSIKAELDGDLCSAIWDIYDTTGNVPDDMSRLCDGYNYLPTNADRLRDLLGQRCSIDSSVFYNSFAEDSGIYNGDIKCQSLTDSDMTDFAGLFEVHGSFVLEESSITTLDELIRLKKVTGTLSIWHNADLSDIDGLSNVLGVANQKLIIDDTEQYDIKADNTKDFCATRWNIYDGAGNIVNDMSKVCNE